MRAQLVMVGALLLTGCGSSVEALCEDLAAECRPPVDEPSCRRQGLDLEEIAENLECEDFFDDYLECADRAQCAWEASCSAKLDDLQRCVTR